MKNAVDWMLNKNTCLNSTLITISCSRIVTTRGYTGHEMLWEFGLINMNGRVYDPVLGMFLSPDNYIQSPTDPLNYNRYSYCLNTSPTPYKNAGTNVIMAYDRYGNQTRLYG